MPRNRFSKKNSSKRCNIPKSRVRRKKLEIPKKELKKIEIRARKTYFNCVKLFKKDVISEEDVIQEAYLVAYETLNHYNNIKERDLIKLIHQRVSWRMKNLIRNAKSTDKKFVAIGTDDLSKIEPLIEAPQKNTFLETAFMTCNQKEYKLLYEIFVKSKTFAEIAEKRKISRQRVEQIYSKIIKKIRRKLKITI